MGLVNQLRRVALVVATGGLLGAVAVTMPARAAVPTVAPGDVVTVNGISVTAPSTSGAVALNVDRLDGSSQLLVVTTDAAGHVRIGDGSETATAGAPDGGSPPKCDDPAFNLINGASWPTSYDWSFRRSTTPDELTRRDATKALRQSVSNITGTRNGCGLADRVGLTNEYQGSTTQPSDVSSTPSCAAKPGSHNVTEFGPIRGGVIAATCTYSTGPDGDIVAADIRMSTNVEWWTGGQCTEAFGVRAVQTHEVGHAVGLAGVDELDHGNLTMSAINDRCSNFEASLGRGDVLGLRALY